MSGTRTLTEAELNRALLDRQLLLERSNGPLTKLLERMGGLQAQYAPSGTWERRRADLYAAAEHWLEAPPAQLDEARGIELLVRRYLGAFGPSAADEIANWAGVPPKRLAPALEAIELRKFEAEDGA